MTQASRAKGSISDVSEALNSVKKHHVATLHLSLAQLVLNLLLLLGKQFS
jgi:hypothetical protein